MLAVNELEGKHLVKLTVKILRYVKILKIVDDWVGIGFTLKQYSPGKNMYEGQMYNYSLLYIDFCESEKAWIKTAQEHYEHKIKLNKKQLR